MQCKYKKGNGESNMDQNYMTFVAIYLANKNLYEYTYGKDSKKTNKKK